LTRADVGCVEMLGEKGLPRDTRHHLTLAVDEEQGDPFPLQILLNMVQNGTRRLQEATVRLDLVILPLGIQEAHGKTIAPVRSERITASNDFRALQAGWIGFQLAGMPDLRRQPRPTWPAPRRGWCEAA
jgi:hypothetical protein